MVDAELNTSCPSFTAGHNPSAAKSFAMSVPNESYLDFRSTNTGTPTTDMFDAQTLQELATSVTAGTSSYPLIPIDSIVSFVDESLYRDPSYRPPALDFARPSTPPLSYEHARGALAELEEHTPIAPRPSSWRRLEQPLYHYYTHYTPDAVLTIPQSSGPTATNEENGFKKIVPFKWTQDETILPHSTLYHTQDPEKHMPSTEIVDTEIQSPEQREGWIDSSSSNAANVSKFDVANQIVHHPRPCVECTFARVPCYGCPGHACTRCTKLLYETRTSKPAAMLNYDTKDSRAFILRIVFFDIEAAQGQLSNLRDEVGKLSTSSKGATLETLCPNPIICHIVSSEVASHHGWTAGVKVVIKHLATTRDAHSRAISSKLDFPEPGLDPSQLDSFLDIASRMKKLQSLNQAEDIIATAIKIADYLGILFNWDTNTMCFEQRHGGCSRAAAKTIVLETVYAMVHRVQDLMEKILVEVHKSLKGRRDLSHDPATISCALWIIYSSLNKFQKLSWDAKTLQNLKVFLNSLHDRASGAIASIEHYRREVAFVECGKRSVNLQAYKELVVAKKVPRTATAFTYEQFRPTAYSIGTMPTFSHKQSYTDVLEDGIADNDHLYDEPDLCADREPKDLGASLDLASGCLRLIHPRKLTITHPDSDFDDAGSSVSSHREQPEMEPTLAMHPSGNDADCRSSEFLFIESSKGYADTNLSLAAEIQHVRAILAQLEEQQKKTSMVDDTLWCGLEAHEDWPSTRPRVGPPRDIELAALEAKAAERLQSLSDEPRRKKQRI
ncbi:uncharacterized protein LY89DRAFT_208565 [Mollisia scopiformis]|uniref:Uncharacterized protein n=1 Tax=Mollisia scopiformis TaxID=149040 RepID=A0A194WWY4_MOLSC|nr:uncharacterized protein LY89DRAFT_208565 [Mollisia scopiformis]KUJ12491.1 hypothetical protein LY89DRAFT_208565 [Mollisia scopiformis]